VLGEQCGQRDGVEQRHVAVGDEHGPGEIAWQLVEAAADRVAGAVLLLLHGDGDGRLERLADLGQVLGDLVAAVADDDRHPRRAEPGRGPHGVLDERAAGQPVQHLRRRGPHPGALAGGEDDRADFSEPGRALRHQPSPFGA
jgi:hypothetical protein